MKPQKGMHDAEILLAMLQESKSFRKSVGDVSSPDEIDGLLERNGFSFDVYHLIRAVAEYINDESEESKGWSWSLHDDWFLELL